MNKAFLYGVGILLAGTVFGLWYFSAVRSPYDLEAFAACLADKNATMYGADWCPHCRSEKYRFGDAFRLVPYVECPANVEKCLALGIEAYPTWIFDGGRRTEGDIPLEQLAVETGCELKKKQRTP